MLDLISKRFWIVIAVTLVTLAGLSLAYWRIESRSQVLLDERQAAAPTAVVAATTPAAVALGGHLVAVTACAGCHGPNLTGGPLNVAGTQIETPNLTIEAHRLTDAQIDRALRQGLRPDGASELIMPAQAYARFTDGEVAAIIGYLRSLPAKGAPSPAPRPGLILRASLLIGSVKTARRQLAAARPPLDAGPRVETGRHLAAVACGRCHGADLGGIRDQGPDLTVRTYYDRAKFQALIGKGEAIGEGNMQLMTDTAEASFSHFTPAEIDSIYDYLDARDGVLIARARLKNRS